MVMDFLSSFAQSFLNAVLPTLFLAIVSLIVAWLTEKIQDIRVRMSDRANWVIDEAVRAAVLAAEQVHLKDFAIDKKDYALTAASNWLAARHIKVDLLELDTRIESAVMAEFNKDKQPASELAKTVTGND